MEIGREEEHATTHAVNIGHILYSLCAQLTLASISKHTRQMAASHFCPATGKVRYEAAVKVGFLIRLEGWLVVCHPRCWPRIVSHRWYDFLARSHAADTVNRHARSERGGAHERQAQGHGSRDHTTVCVLHWDHQSRQTTKSGSRTCARHTASPEYFQERGLTTLGCWLLEVQSRSLETRLSGRSRSLL